MSLITAGYYASTVRLALRGGLLIESDSVGGRGVGGDSHGGGGGGVWLRGGKKRKT